LSTTSSDWAVSTDIYGIVNQVDNLKKKYIEDENETTLAVGIFGFLGDTEAKKIQTAIINTGELGNEMFPQRAKLDKNIVTHAVYCNIEGINAAPAAMTINIAVKESDLANYMVNNEFVFDHTCPITAGDYEFHLDYDIVLKRAKRTKVTTASDGNSTTTEYYVYNAYYDMTNVNNLSTITNPYLKQPYVMNFNNYRYVFMQALVRQCTIETTTDKMITASVIDNKSFTFTFSNQLAGFDVYVTEDGTTTRLTPLLYGEAVDTGVTDYCWYLYMSEDAIRIGFDQNSYLPGLSAEIKVVAYTCLGASGNFDYKSTSDDSGFYVDFTSTYSNNKKVTCYVNCATNSTDGADKKSTSELKALIPKMAMSRGYITTETDLNGYFNLISQDTNRMKLQKKVDNQLERIWYCYLLAKDSLGNIVPTNTLPIKVALTDSYVKQSAEDTGRYIIPCGTTFVYDPTLGYATYIDSASIPTKYSTSYFGSKYYYRIIHNIVINVNPLYCSYYNTIINLDSYFEYVYINNDLDVGFIANTNHFERTLLDTTTKDQYRLTFSLAQSVNEDYGLLKLGTDGTTIATNNMKVILVIYNDGVPYRYTEASIVSFDSTTYISKWKVVLNTDNEFDTSNRIKLTGMYEAGSTNSNYGYFADNCDAYVYILGKFSGVSYLDEISGTVPASSLTGYSVINTYKMADGLTLFRNFTKVMNTRIRENTSADLTVTNYDISGIPMVGEHFFMSEANVTDFMDTMTAKKAYIDKCLTVLENNMDIDFKFYNTYGYSNTYNIGDTAKTSLGNIDTTWNFKLMLANNYDSKTKDNIASYIKNYIEDLNDTGDLHIPNLLHDIKEEYGSLITYIEYINFNDNALGVNHILLNDVISADTVPEFINVRNALQSDGTTLVPDINIEIVT
jgi:hypothetical protein